MLKHLSLFVFFFFNTCLPLTLWSDEPGSEKIQLILPKHRLQPTQLGLIINTRDPVSVQVGKYYQQQRNIPQSNIVHIEIDPNKTSLTQDEFEKVFQEVTEKIDDDIQALAITWTSPYKVNCMSITSAFAFGYDPALCSKTDCTRTRISPYYNSVSISPYSDLNIRPTMSIAALDFQHARQLIDRGKTSDKSNPVSDTYLLSTHDRKRNVRSIFYPQIQKTLSLTTSIKIVKKNAIRNKENILFYFTGLKRVPYLDSLTFVPGAVADHLTSTGGKLTQKKQMSALRWLEAGATGSYGTVVEPCNLTGKFPNPLILMDTYLYGSTLIEAYWKSVQQPGEGIFIGDPLAAPFDGYQLRKEKSALILETRTLTPGLYRVSQARRPDGPYQAWLKLILVRPHQTIFQLPLTDYPVIKIQKVFHRIRRRLR